MIDGQKYGAEASQANFLDLTAKQPVNQSSTESDGTSFSSDQPNTDSQDRSYWQRQYQINTDECRQCLAEYADVHELIERFTGEIPAADTVEVVNELFFDWLCQSHRKVTKAHARHISFNALRVVNFLTALHELWSKASHNPLASDLAEGGQSHE